MSVKIHFPGKNTFYKELRSRINAYFNETGQSPTGGKKLAVKSIIILSMAVFSYLYLVFWSTSWVETLIFSFILAQSFALIGFNIMHDSVHGSFSRSRKLNTLMGYTMDFLGGNARLWYHKHNILHHTYTNIAGMDTDIETNNLLRMSPHQPWRPWHRFQLLYAFPAYSLLTISMVLFTDFQKFINGRIGRYKLPRAGAGESFRFWLTKAVYFFYALVLPMFFHQWWVVLAVFFLVHLILGFTFSIVFQLAHTMEDNHFPEPDPVSGALENEWAIHQIETTANFATHSKFLYWYIGGLNFQIEHHLFAKISHVHYPQISKIVRETCEEFGVKYVHYSNMFSAVLTHIRFLYHMSKKPAQV